MLWTTTNNKTDMTQGLVLPIIRACLFDMDGLLLDSEDKYTICTNEILREYGKPDLPWKIKAQLQGRPGPEAGRIFHEWANLPISREEFHAKITVLQRKYFPQTKPLPGVVQILQKLSQTSNPTIHLALATSSHKSNFTIKTAHLKELFSVFTEERRVLGDDPRIPPGRGKPAPDIYLLALDIINQGIRRKGLEREVQPEECLVLEDSVPGVAAGRSAGMQVVWCPHSELLNEYRGREKEVLAGLTGEYEQETQQTQQNIEKGKMGKQVMRVAGKIDDGWAVLLESLEEFPYKKFGIHV